MTIDRNSLEYSESVMARICPSDKDRFLVLSLLLHSIEMTEKIAPSAWSVTLFENLFRLNVGPVEVMTFGSVDLNREQNEQYISLRLLLFGDIASIKKMLPKTELDVCEYSIEPSDFKSIAQPQSCFIASARIINGALPERENLRFNNLTKAILSFHDNFIGLAAVSPKGKPRQGSNFRKSHSPGLYQYAKKFISANAYISSQPEDALYAEVVASLNGDKEARLKRLQSAPQYPVKLISQVTIFKRNPDVVAETLLRAKGSCESCKRSAPFIRASDGTPYLEVHHKITLANGGADTLENTIALCPNCHRAAHYA